MNNERRKFPRVPMQGKVSMQIAGIVQSGVSMDISPSGIQLECTHKLIEQLSKFKSDAGLFPNFELEFNLKNSKAGSIRSVCNVSYCRRLSQDKYHLGVNFITLADSDEELVSEFIDHAVAA